MHTEKALKSRAHDLASRSLGAPACSTRTSAFELFSLRGDRYERIDESAVIPELDLARILHYLQDPDQHAALKAFRDELRGTR